MGGKHTRSSCSFSPLGFCLASLDSGSSFFFGFGSSEGTGIDKVGSGIVTGDEDGETGRTWGKVTFVCGRASLITLVSSGTPDRGRVGSDRPRPLT